MASNVTLDVLSWPCYLKMEGNLLRNKVEMIKPHIIVMLFLSAVTFALYWQALRNNFLIYWDDNGYVTKNIVVQRISWGNISTAFTSFYVGNYAPVQIISYMFDFLIWGMRPAGFIFTNILIHVVNGFLFYYLLTKLSWQRLTACAAALIFLVNPVQVESVVWISQRKNVLSMLFFLLSFIWYIMYSKKSGKWQGLLYLSSIIAFILSLLAKSASIILPFVLVSFDLFVVPRYERKDLKKLLINKIPFIVVAFLFGLITIKSQSMNTGGGLTSYINGSPLDTMFTMLPILIQYLKLVIWPIDLSAVYAPVIKTGIDFEVALAALELSIIIAIGIFLYHRRSELLFWIVLFFLSLLPVSQIVPIVTLMNDRYLYFPMLGVAAFIVSITVFAINNADKYKNFIGTAVSITFLLLLGHYLIVTYERIPVWKDENALWEDAVRKVPNSPKAHFNYAHILAYQGRDDEAEIQYELGLNLNPKPFERYALASLYMKDGHLDKAKEEYQRFLLQYPNSPEARNNLAIIYFNEGMLNEAIEQYKIAFQYDPNWARGYNNLAVIYTKSGDTNNAIKYFNEALRLNPNNAEFHYNLGNVLFDKGSKEKALREFEIAAKLDPHNPLYAMKVIEISDIVKGKITKKRK